MGMGGNAELALNMKSIIESAGYELIIISEWDNATIKWNIDTWHEELNKCDVVLCPCRDVQPAKSNVKVTTAMALGLPVIASPLKAYEEVIQHGKNGYLCTTENEWLSALIELKDANKRKSIGENAKKSISNYMLEPITSQWVQLLFDLTLDKIEVQKTDEAVDIIIASYNNVEYLKLCINSIRDNTNSAYRIIISDAGSNKETWDYLNALKGVSIIGQQDKRLNYSQTCNEGILRSFSKYFVILNSDVIVSKGWLTNLVNKIESVSRLAACGVLSNCDRGWMHGVKGRPIYDMKLPSGVELVPGMKINQVYVNELYDFMQTCNNKYKDKYVSQEWVAVYATIFARSAINEVGLFDPNFKTGCEDLDLCIRLRKHKYEIGQAIDSFVFHFGGVSRGSYEIENNNQYREEDVYNHQYLKQKYAKEKIVIYTGPAFERWNKKKVLQGMAGSETWAMELARAFSKKNYLVTVYIDLDTNNVNEWVIEEDGERYRHYSKLNEDLQYDYVDYFISSRSCDVFSNNVHCMNKYVMIHDVWLSFDSKYDTKQWQIKKFAVLSDWHKEFVMSHHNIPADKIMLTANGKDLSIYSNVDNVKKKNKIFYSSSLDRGLLELLKIFPILRKNVPDLELIIAYGLYNWEQAIKVRGNQKTEVDHLNEIKELMKQPGINYVGRLSKEELAKQQMECKAWLYPTWFWETFCITAVDAGVSKCALVTSNLAGLKTTLYNAAILINGNSRSEEYQKKFIEESIKVLTDDKYRKEWADKAYNKVVNYTWDKIAENWIIEFKGQNKIKKLNLGCGGKKIEGYVGVDIFKHENVDEIFSMDNIPYGDASIDGLYSEHALEHLTFKAAERAVKEWYRVLKDGCELILKIPDLQSCCESYLNPPEHILKRGVSFQSAREWFRYTIFGRQMSLSGELDEAQVHKSGYSKQEIRALLENVGFKITSITNYDGWDTPSIEIKAFK
jgi:glycosyltransferase involved in cell wall biosynthesis